MPIPRDIEQNRVGAVGCALQRRLRINHRQRLYLPSWVQSFDRRPSTIPWALAKPAPCTTSILLEKETGFGPS